MLEVPLSRDGESQDRAAPEKEKRRKEKGKDLFLIKKKILPYRVFHERDYEHYRKVV